MTFIRVERRDSVGIITIDRKERFNSLDVETARDLRKAGLSFARDEQVRAVILRGIRNVFCSGADLKYIRAGGDANDLSYLKPSQQGYGEIFKQILEYIHSTISEIRRAPKPFIAAVDGIAAAGGFGLAMSCDLVIASERATFEWAYGKTGLTGALDYNLVTRVLPVEGFDDAVLAIARQAASGPTEALAIAKGLINNAAGMDRLDYHLDRELENLARIADGSNFAEGIDAFFAKREPVFGAK